MSRIGVRFAFSPELSPDGAHVAYLAARSVLGLRAGGIDLHVVDSDGRNDRVLGTLARQVDSFRRDDAYAGVLSFSPDGRWLLVRDGLEMKFFALDGSSQRSVALHDTKVRSVSSLGWSADGGRLILCSVDPETKLWELDVDSLQTELKLDTAGGRWRELCPFRLSGIGIARDTLFIPASVYNRKTGSRAWQIQELDRRSYRPRVVAASGCTPRIGDPDGEMHIETCESSGPYRHYGSLRGESLAERLGELRGLRTVIYIGPSGAHRVEYGPAEVVATGVQGDAWRFAHEGREVMGWLGEDHLVLVRDEGTASIRELFVADLRKRTVRRVYPPLQDLR